MTKILLIGAGRSATSLIEYLLEHAAEHSWHITVADMDLRLAKEKAGNSSFASAISFDIRKEEERRSIIQQHDFVISMLPAYMHGDVARDCVEFGKHMATASYVSKDMKALDKTAQEKNLVLLNECGLDPGIDHASAMKLIDEIKHNGGTITSFKSFTGGLVAPESNDNPWGYKFSWNPRNVVLAGQGTAQYLEKGRLQFIPYNRLYTQIDTVEIEGYGKFDAYANRDSIAYKSLYGLENIQTMLRGTFRQHGYCKAWNVFVQLGLTDDSSIIANSDQMSYTDLLESFLPASNSDLVTRLKQTLGSAAWDNEIHQMMNYLELFSHKPIRLKEGSPAQLLQDLLEEKWKLQENDKDMIVMQHQFEYQMPNKTEIQKINSSLIVLGKDQQHTAMALTVGLPLAICVKNFLTGKFQLSGVQIPIRKEIYEPLLKELEEHQIIFQEN